MSFTVELLQDQLTVEAGSTAVASIAIKNTGDVPLPVEILLEGLDGEWFSMPVSTVTLDAGTQQTEKVYFKPPKSSESLAGTYPFVIRVRSMESGEGRTVQGVLDVQPYHYLTMEVSPKKGTFSPTRKDNSFQATLMNLGNAEHVLQMFGNDPEDVLSYTFEQEQVTIGPGQTKSVEVTIAPLKSQAFSQARLHGFTLGARSVHVPSVVSSANAQLEQRPLITPASLLLTLLLFGLMVGWILALPKPPSIDFVRVNPSSVIAEKPVRINWRAQNADQVRITLNGKVLIETGDTSGEMTIPATEGGTVEAVAISGGKFSKPKSAKLEVTPKPIAADPEIESFSVSPNPANKGERIEIRYKVNDGVTRLVLMPLQENLDPSLDSKWIDADREGELELTLRAYNADGKMAERKRTVSVVDPTRPQILSFNADKKVIGQTPDTVTLSWSVKNASTIEIFDGSEKVTVFESKASRSFTVDKTTTFTLTILDGGGRTKTQKVTVVYKPVESPPPGETLPDTPTGDPPTSTAPPR